MIVKIIIPGEPKGKGRPRMSTKTGRAFTPKDTVMYENLVKMCYQDQAGKMLEGEIKAAIHAYFSIPKSTSKKKKQEMIEYKIRPTKKPDTDNVAKIILDSLNGIAYKDDSQVVSLSVNKYYAENPRVELILKEVKDA